ncbi:hypothetical protein [Calothrix sp. UHCC 0171]|uniref:hypothetical protein n=1 Tax=Calothrix sp. UHCC 0171 TaxID=3110245 RepID=UPI002B1F55B5|nr:hypothetical protein [Calothrix sp. UHCC 0171]MEA5573895.1 hypothetical protein [Calothrix sp. UHCC 0171]
MKREYFISIVATLLCLVQIGNIHKVNAAPVQCADVEDGCLKINKDALKDLKIKINDIVADGKTKLIVPDGTPLQSSPIPVINQIITFRVENLWELKIPENNQAGLTVDYIYDKLQSANVGTSEIQLVAIDGQTISTRSSSQEGYIIVTGGGTLKFDVSNIKASGNYLGNLQIRVTPGNSLP